MFFFTLSLLISQSLCDGDQINKATLRYSEFLGDETPIAKPLDSTKVGNWENRLHEIIFQSIFREVDSDPYLKEVTVKETFEQVFQKVQTFWNKLQTERTIFNKVSKTREGFVNTLIINIYHRLKDVFLFDESTKLVGFHELSNTIIDGVPSEDYQQKFFNIVRSAKLANIEETFYFKTNACVVGESLYDNIISEVIRPNPEDANRTFDDVFEKFNEFDKLMEVKYVDDIGCEFDGLTPRVLKLILSDDELVKLSNNYYTGLTLDFEPEKTAENLKGNFDKEKFARLHDFDQFLLGFINGDPTFSFLVTKDIELARTFAQNAKDTHFSFDFLKDLKLSIPEKLKKEFDIYDLPKDIKESSIKKIGNYVYTLYLISRSNGVITPETPKDTATILSILLNYCNNKLNPEQNPNKDNWNQDFIPMKKYFQKLINTENGEQFQPEDEDSIISFLSPKIDLDDPLWIPLEEESAKLKKALEINLIDRINDISEIPFSEISRRSNPIRLQRELLSDTSIPNEFEKYPSELETLKNKKGEVFLNSKPRKDAEDLEYSDEYSFVDIEPKPSSLLNAEMNDQIGKYAENLVKLTEIKQGDDLQPEELKNNIDKVINFFKNINQIRPQKILLKKFLEKMNPPQQIALMKEIIHSLKKKFVGDYEGFRYMITKQIEEFNDDVLGHVDKNKLSLSNDSFDQSFNDSFSLENSFVNIMDKSLQNKRKESMNIFRNDNYLFSKNGEDSNNLERFPDILNRSFKNEENSHELLHENLIIGAFHLTREGPFMPGQNIPVKDREVAIVKNIEGFVELIGGYYLMWQVIDIFNFYLPLMQSKDENISQMYSSTMIELYRFVIHIREKPSLYEELEMSKSTLLDLFKKVLLDCTQTMSEQSPLEDKPDLCPNTYSITTRLYLLIHYYQVNKEEVSEYEHNEESSVESLPFYNDPLFGYSNGEYVENSEIMLVDTHYFTYMVYYFEILGNDTQQVFQKHSAEEVSSNYKDLTTEIELLKRYMENKVVKNSSIDFPTWRDNIFMESEIPKLVLWRFFIGARKLFNGYFEQFIDFRNFRNFETDNNIQDFLEVGEEDIPTLAKFMKLQFQETTISVGDLLRTHDILEELLKGKEEKKISRVNKHMFGSLLEKSITEIVDKRRIKSITNFKWLILSALTDDMYELYARCVKKQVWMIIFLDKYNGQTVPLFEKFSKKVNKMYDKEQKQINEQDSLVEDQKTLMRYEGMNKSNDNSSYLEEDNSTNLMQGIEKVNMMKFKAGEHSLDDEEDEDEDEDLYSFKTNRMDKKDKNFQWIVKQVKEKKDDQNLHI